MPKYEGMLVRFPCSTVKFDIQTTTSQGEVTTSERKLGKTVPLIQIPYIMRGLGFYASEYEIQNFMNELRMMLAKETDPTPVSLEEEKKKRKQEKPISDSEIQVDFDTFLKGVFVAIKLSFFLVC